MHLIILDTHIYIEPLDGATPRTRRAEAERAAVAAMVAAHFGPSGRLGHRPDGAPYIEDSAAHISVSHSRHYAVLAVSGDGPIGVDIEEPRYERLRHVATPFLTAAELAAVTDDEALLRAWTLKEALFKATSHLYPPHTVTLIDLPLPATAPADERVITLTAHAALALVTPRGHACVTVRQ